MSDEHEFVTPFVRRRSRTPPADRRTSAQQELAGARYPGWHATRTTLAEIRAQLGFDTEEIGCEALSFSRAELNQGLILDSERRPELERRESEELIDLTQSDAGDTNICDIDSSDSDMICSDDSMHPASRDRETSASSNQPPGYIEGSRNYVAMRRGRTRTGPVTIAESRENRQVYVELTRTRRMLALAQLCIRELEQQVDRLTGASAANTRRRQRRSDLSNDAPPLCCDDTTESGSVDSQTKVAQVDTSIQITSDDESVAWSPAAWNRLRPRLPSPTPALPTSASPLTPWPPPPLPPPWSPANVPFPTSPRLTRHTGTPLRWLHRDTSRCPRTPFQRPSEDVTLTSPSPGSLVDLSDLADYQTPFGREHTPEMTPTDTGSLFGSNELFGSSLLSVAEPGDILFGSPPFSDANDMFGSPSSDMFGSPAGANESTGTLFGSPPLSRTLRGQPFNRSTGLNPLFPCPRTPPDLLHVGRSVPYPPRFTPQTPRISDEMSPFLQIPLSPPMPSRPASDTQSSRASNASSTLNHSVMRQSVSEVDCYFYGMYSSPQLQLTHPRCRLCERPISFGLVVGFKRRWRASEEWAHINCFVEFANDSGPRLIDSHDYIAGRNRIPSLNLAAFHPSVSPAERERMMTSFHQIAASKNLLPWRLPRACRGVPWTRSNAVSSLSSQSINPLREDLGARHTRAMLPRIPPPLSFTPPARTFSTPGYRIDISPGPSTTDSREQARLQRTHELKVKRIKLEAPVSVAEFDAECCICMERIIRTVSIVRTLPCKHSYHRACIDQWILQKTVCPLDNLEIEV